MLYFYTYFECTEVGSPPCPCQFCDSQLSKGGGEVLCFFFKMFRLIRSSLFPPLRIHTRFYLRFAVPLNSHRKRVAAFWSRSVLRRMLRQGFGSRLCHPEGPFSFFLTCFSFFMVDGGPPKISSYNAGQPSLTHQTIICFYFPRPYPLVHFFLSTSTIFSLLTLFNFPMIPAAIACSSPQAASKVSPPGAPPGGGGIQPAASQSATKTPPHQKLPGHPTLPFCPWVSCHPAGSCQACMGSCQGVLPR